MKPHKEKLTHQAISFFPAQDEAAAGEELGHASCQLHLNVCERKPEVKSLLALAHHAAVSPLLIPKP